MKSFKQAVKDFLKVIGMGLIMFASLIPFQKKFTAWLSKKLQKKKKDKKENNDED